jgi:hypothetical protein
MKQKKQYIKYTKQYLKQELKEIENILLRKLSKAEHSGAIPEHWFETGNHQLSKAIIHSFCLDKPYQPLINQKDVDNLHLFL